MAATDEIVLLLDGLRNRIATDVLQQVADIVEEALRETSPSPDYPQNAYATGRFKKTWRQRREGPERIVIVNDASKKGRDYTEHANRGDTRYGGPRSARGYRLRGGVDYTEQGLDLARERINRELPGLIDGD